MEKVKPNTVTFQIDKDLYTQIKVHVAQEGSTIREFMSSAIVDKFDKEMKRKA